MRPCTSCRRLAICVAALLIGGCGGDEPPPDTAVELEDQLGFSDTGVLERQSRVEGRIRECMKQQGFDYVPVDPLAQRAALTGKARMTDEEFLDQFGYGISTLFGRGRARPTPTSASARAWGRPTGAAYDRALWRRERGLDVRRCHRRRRGGRAGRVHEAGDRGGVRRRRGARGHPGQVRRARGALAPGPANGQGHRGLVDVHGEAGLHVRGAGADRCRPDQALQGDRRTRHGARGGRAGRPVPTHTTRPRWPRSSATR